MTDYGKARPSWVDYPVHERLLTSLTTDTPLLVDVEGGLDRDISHFYSRFPDAEGALILQDTPSVITQAQSSIPALPPAITATAQDFFTPQPVFAHHARAYYLHLMLRDWDHASCRTMLGHVRDAMKPGYSKVLINENVEGWSTMMQFRLITETLFASSFVSTTHMTILGRTGNCDLHLLRSWK